jgi:hypothetical protein
LFLLLTCFASFLFPFGVKWNHNEMTAKPQGDGYNASRGAYRRQTKGSSD